MQKVGGYGRLTVHARGGEGRTGMERGRGRRAVSGSAHRACVRGSDGGNGMCCWYRLGMGHRRRW